MPRWNGLTALYITSPRALAHTHTHARFAHRYLTMDKCGCPQRGCLSTVRLLPHHAVVRHSYPIDEASRSMPRRNGLTALYHDRTSPRALAHTHTDARSEHGYLTMDKCGCPQRGCLSTVRLLPHHA